MSLGTALTLSLSPGAHGATASSHQPSMTINLATKLDALAIEKYRGATDNLSAELEIDFSISEDELTEDCSGLTITGPVLSGLPDMEFGNDDVAYNGSTCAYSIDKQWLVYSDSTCEQDPELHIHFNRDNVYDLFTWNSGLNYVIDPPIIDADRLAALRLRFSIDSVEMHLPMALVLNPVGTNSPIVLKELQYADAPVFSGGRGDLTCGTSPVFTVKNSEILTAVANQDGEYDLNWRVYRGQGEITYSLTCQLSPLIGSDNHSATWTERVGNRSEDGYDGGAGISQMVDVTVARIKIRKIPLPFIDTLSVSEFGDEGNGYRSIARDGGIDFGLYKQSRWYGTFNGCGIILSWEGNQLYADGRQVAATQRDITCAAIRNSDTLIYVSKNDTTLDLIHLPLIEGSAEVLVASQSEPDNKATTYVISPDATKIATFRRATITPTSDVFPRYNLDAIDDIFDGGAIYVADITEGFGAFELAHDHRLLVRKSFNVDIETQSFSLSPVNCLQRSGFDLQHLADWTIVYDFEWNAVHGIRWNGDELVPLVQKIAFDCNSDGRFNERHQQTLISSGYDPPPCPLCPPMTYYWIYYTGLNYSTRESTEYHVKINDVVCCDGSISSVTSKTNTYNTKTNTPYVIARNPVSFTSNVAHTEAHHLNYTHHQYWNQDGCMQVKKGQCTLEKVFDTEDKVFDLVFSENDGYGSVKILINDNEVVTRTLSINADNRAYDLAEIRCMAEFRPITNYDDAFYMYEKITGDHYYNILDWGVVCDSGYGYSDTFIIQVRDYKFFKKELVFDSICYTAQQYFDDAIVPPERCFWFQNLDNTCNLVSLKLNDIVGHTLLDYHAVNNVEINTDAHTQDDRIFVITPTCCLIKAAPSEDPEPPGGDASAITADALIDAINAYRLHLNLSQVVKHSALTSAIESHVVYLIAHNDCALSHTGQDNSSLYARLVAVEYDSTVIGEMLAAGITSVNDAVGYWANSASNQAILTDSRWADIGVAIGECENGNLIWGVNFGRY